LVIVLTDSSAKSIVRPLAELAPQNGVLGLKVGCDDHHQKALFRNLLFRDFWDIDPTARMQAKIIQLI
jgi:hypothetical protein